MVAGAALALTAGSMPARAEFPDKPIRLVVPYPAGGTPDILGRIIGEHVAKTLKQAIVVENRGGAGGNIGVQAVTKSPADGYTLLMCAFNCSVAPWLYTPKPYDVARELEPVVMVGTVPSVLVVNPKVPANTLGELVAYAKANPGKLNAASSGAGGSAHLAIVLMRMTAGVDIVHVPYKGAGQVAADLLAGQVDMYFDNLPASLQSIRAGKLRALGVASTTRAAAIPDVPTFAEAGIANFLVTPWFGVMAPAGTPPDVVAKLNQAFNAALQDKTTASKMQDLGLVIAGGTPAAMGKFVADDTARWGEVIRINKITVD
ncbi:tripartite tricarboxylate transporter substrate binding protein [soil metagenome]